MENDGPSKNGGGVEFAGLEKDGLENDEVEQEQTYILHPMKNFNVYDIVSSINLKTYYTAFRVILIKNITKKKSYNDHSYTSCVPVL